MAWGTVARWLESAATCAARFNDLMLKGFVIRELQADEIRTFVGTKKRVSWVLTTLEVWPRNVTSGSGSWNLVKSNVYSNPQVTIYTRSL